MRLFLYALVAFILFISAAARAADGEYNLFNPMPDDKLRSFTTDRPTKANSPITVDAGHFQYEADLVNWSYDRNTYSGTTTSNVLLFDPTFKVGLTQSTDLEVALAPININHANIRATNTGSSFFGFGDVFTRLKFNVMGDDGGTYALALVPYVKAPMASRNIGNNHWEGGGYAPFTINLPDDWALTFQTELDILENAALDGTYRNYQNLINVSHPVVKNVTGFAEFWTDVNGDRNAPSQYTLDFAAAWLISDNVQFDAGINLGLNKAATDYQPYLGLSQRF